jgi:hypothetical protein
MSVPFLDDAVRRPLPSLAQFIDGRNGGARAGDYAEFTALADLAERTLAQSEAGLPVEQAAFLRLWKGFSIATIELCNIERRSRVPVEVLVAMLPRVLACAAMYAFASVAKDDTPFREIAKLLSEEFRAGAKVAADGMTERQG